MLARILVITLILFCLELGLFLLVVPWTDLWRYNYFLFRWPALNAWMGNDFLRGAISGLGLVDLGLALRFLYRFRELTGQINGILGPPASPQEPDYEQEPPASQPEV